MLGVLLSFPALSSTASFYAYDVPEGSSWNGQSLTPVQQRSHLLLADTDDGLSVILVHDRAIPDDPDGGRAETRVEFLDDPDGGFRTVADDPGDAGGYTGNPGDSVFTAGHNWLPCCTDGVAISGVDLGSSILVEFTEVDGSASTPPILGLNEWYAYSADGTEIQLAFEEDRRVLLEVIADLLPPSFDPPSPCGETLQLVAGIGTSFEVVASATNGLPGETVTLDVVDFDGIFGQGATMTPPLPISGPTVASTFDWTPGAAAAGTHELIFVATNQFGMESACTVTLEVHVSTLDWSEAPGYSSQDGIDPNLGQSGHLFEFRAVYSDPNDEPPASGSPILELDWDGQDPADVLLPMVPLDGDDTYDDGKEYFYQLPLDALSPGQSYRYRFSAEDSLGLQATGEPTLWHDGPVVVADGSDLAIFANDIHFSDPNPDPGEPFTVSVTFANNSWIALPDPVTVRVVDPDGFIMYEDVVPQIDAWGTGMFAFEWAFPTMGFFPLRVFIDSDELIAETNELNNNATRPILVGAFSLPGAIELTGLPASVTVHALEWISISGAAQYLGTPLPSPPPVEGATVDYSYSWGGTTSGHTTSTGIFSQSVRAPLELGDYEIEIEVTDYTLSGSAAVAVHVVPGGLPPPVGPDLRVAVSCSPSDPCDGQDVTISWSVANVGNEPAPATTAELLGQDLSNLSTQSIPDLSPGESVSLGAVVVAGGPPGLHWVTGRVDPDSLIAELREENNIEVSRWRVWPDCAELSVSLIWVTDATPCPDQTVGFDFRVTNWGCNPTEPSTAQVYVDGVQVGDPIGVPSIEGRSQSYGISVPQTWVDLGAHTVELVVDPGGLQTECSEGNNTATATVSVGVCDPPEVRPDLEARYCDLGVDVPTAGAGDVVWFQATVRNTGGSASPDAIPVRFTLDGMDWGTDVQVDSLAPGASTLVTASVPWTVDLDPHSLRVLVDPGDDLVEWSEANNEVGCVLPYELHPVNLQRCPPWSARMFGDCAPCEGEANWIHGRVVNTGALALVGEVTVEFVEHYGGASLGLGTATVVNLQDHGVCAPYSIEGATLDHVFDGLGGHVVDFIIDPQNEWAEFDEGNNTITGGVAVRDCTLPDLFIYSEHINPSELNPDFGPSEVNPDFGTELESITVTAFNAGNEAALDVEVDVLIDGELHCSLLLPEVPGVTGPGGTVAGSASVECTVPWPVPSDPPYIHVIEACLDPLDAIVESREDNNCATRAIIAGDAPDLWVTDDDVSISNCLPAAGEVVTLEALVHNSGGADGSGLVVFTYVDPMGTSWPVDEVPVNVPAVAATPGEQMVFAEWKCPVDTLYEVVSIEVDIVEVVPQEFDETNNHAELVLPCTRAFSRGDCSTDGSLDIGDAILLLSHILPPNLTTPECLDACDANDDGLLDIGDVIQMFSALFPPNAPLPDPYLVCGADPTDDPPGSGGDLGCESFPACP